MGSPGREERTTPAPDTGSRARVRTVLELQGFTYAYPGSGLPVLDGIDLTISEGECHCLTGDTGSGKTTLALALKGLLPPGRQRGSCRIAPGPSDRATVGVVHQNPETQLLAATVGAEVAFGLESLGVRPDDMPGRVLTALDAVDLDRPLDHPVDQLSMGQKYRLILAAHLAMNPAVLVLDEPAAQLDPAGLDALVEVIHGLKATGTSFLICEHHPAPLSAVIDIVWRIADGRLSPTTISGEAPQSVPLSTAGTDSSDHQAYESPVIQTEGLGALGPDGGPIWSNVNLDIERGSRVALCGANGSGKTTFLRCLAGIRAPDAGQVRIFGHPPAAPRLRGRVGFLYQNPPRQLFENTVLDEVAFPLRRLARGERVPQDAATDALELCGIAELAGQSPHRLSYGQKHLVALASVLATRPELLLLDDPFAGLDGPRREGTLRLMADVARQNGTAVIWTTHHPMWLSDWAQRTLIVEEGTIVPT